MADNGAIEQLTPRALTYIVGHDATGKVGREPVADFVKATRQIGVGAGLAGGGSLSADVTVGLNSASVASLALADSSLQPGVDISSTDALGLAVSGSRIYGRVNDTRNLLDYATTLAARTAVANGSTSPLAFWTDAMADLTANGLKILEIPDGSYQLGTDEELDNTANALIRGISGIPSFTKNGQGPLMSVPNVKPDINLGIALATDVAPPSRAIQLVSGGGASFQANKRYILICDAPLHISNTYMTGEFVVVQNVTGDTITFWSALQYSYTVATNARLLPVVNLYSGVGYQNLVLNMDQNATVANSNSFQNLFGIDIRWCLDYRIDDVIINNALHAGICQHGCVNGRVSRYSGHYFGSTTTGSGDPTSSQGTPGFGYGIRDDGINLGLIATQLNFDRCRHGYTTTGGYTSSERLNYGEPMGAIIGPGIHTNARDMGWDTHNAGRNIQFIGLGTVGGNYGGHQIRSQNTFASDCWSQDCIGPGLWVRGGDGAGTQGDSGVYGNYTAIRTNLGVTADAIDWRERGAILDEGFNNSFEGYRGFSVGGPLLMIGRNGVARGGSYRSGFAKDVCQYTTTAKYVVQVVNANTNANLVIDGLTSQSSDGKVVNVFNRATDLDSSSIPIAVDINDIKGYGQTGGLYSTAGSIAGITLRNSPYQPLQSTVNVYDDFTGPSITGWTPLNGTAASTPALLANAVGLVRLSFGVNSAGTMATNGAQLSSFNIFQASARGLVFEGRMRLQGTTDNVCFIGFTSTTGTLQIPFTIGASNALTVNATNAVGFLYDNSADTKNFWCVSSNASSGQSANTGITPVNATFYDFRCELDVSGNAKFYINGALVGSLSLAVLASAGLSMLISGFCRSTAAGRAADLDFMFGQQSRS